MRVEARKKTEIIMGKTRKEAPDFSKFVEEFLTWSQAQNKASTHKRYRVSSKPLLKYFRGKVSEIDMASVERFKVSRLKECSAAGGQQGSGGSSVYDELRHQTGICRIESG
jgi:hypothetical protein